MNNNQEINTKICRCCKLEKPFTEFNKTKKEKCGIISKCKSCCKEYREQNKERIKEKDKHYRLINKDRIKEYREFNKDKIRERKKEYRKNNKDNKDKKREYDRKYKSKNKDKRNLYEKNRRNRDINYKLAHNLRTYLNIILKSQGCNKRNKAKDLLGCSIQELKLHIEAQFKYGMAWDNHGIYTWHIDHIKPIASFDLSDPKQLKECFHYKNLQPLWAKDNLKKGSKIL